MGGSSDSHEPPPLDPPLTKTLYSSVYFYGARLTLMLYVTSTENAVFWSRVTLLPVFNS